ncbi:hypothetical protein KAS08_02745 [Candidatus Pacearchaeota archaeon]|nr:hypothetical protein [Candidatus Pacearchaeota archaeon]
MSDKIDKRILISILSNSKKISTKIEINKLLKKYLKSKYSANIFNSLTKRNMIKNIFINYYYILDPDEQLSKYTKQDSLQVVSQILNTEKINWYIGLESATKIHGLNWQGLSTTTIINSKFSGTKRIFGSTYIFKKITKPIRKIKLLKKKKGPHSVYFSDKEKTLIDYVYFRKKPPVELTREINNVVLQEYLKDYSKDFKRKVLHYE